MERVENCNYSLMLRNRQICEENKFSIFFSFFLFFCITFSNLKDPLEGGGMTNIFGIVCKKEKRN